MSGKRRSNGPGPQQKRSRPYARPNLGRQHMRTVTRTARRDEPVEEAPQPLESEEEEEQQEQAAVFEDGKAYDALLTLLQAEHPAKKENKRTQVVDDDDVAGANFEEDSEEDAGEDAGDHSEDDDDDDDDDASTVDPFEAHFNAVPEALVEAKANETGKWTVTDKRAVLAYNVATQSSPGDAVALGRVARSTALDAYTSVKKKVLSALSADHGPELAPLDADLWHNMLMYRDINFPLRTFHNNSYRKLYAAHVLNHVFKTRDRIVKNNDVLRHYSDAVKSGTVRPGTAEPEPRDQGFTRPKALILVPTRNAAYEVVEQMIRLSGSAQQENRKRFKQQFYSDGGPPDSKPEDFRAMFRGNSNDFFCLGLRFSRKSVKLYSSFYSSDVLVASPIGLLMILEDPNTSKRQSDFLASIEVLVFDHANQMEMQNWDHVHTVLKYVNRIPKEFHGADFSRIRMWAINDHARLLRQTLVFSEFLTPNINSITTKAQNMAGKVRYRPVITSKTCIMNSVGLKIKQIFQRFDAADPKSAVDARYKYFINSVLPSITKQTSYDDGLLIYIPSYFDYLRVKAHMKAHTKFDFSSIDEYSSHSKTTRARHAFQTGRTKVLLYTERMHHYRRFDLAGVKNVLIYEPPANPLFYKELLRFVGKSVFKSEADVDLSFVKTIYCKWDGSLLERIAGGEKTGVLCNSVNEVFEFR